MDYEVILAEKDAIIAAQKVLLEKVTLYTSNRIQQLEHELAQLKKMIFGSKRERFLVEVNSNQLSLFSSDEITIADPVVDKQHIEYDRSRSLSGPKKHPGRTALPDHLPVEEIVIEPEEDTTGMKRIGEEITETLDYTPASLVRRRTIRPKYARHDSEGIVIGKLPSRPIPKAIAEASLIAYILVSKFIDHLPFYRQIQRFKREYQWVVSDSTINEWFVAVCTLLQPLYEVLKRKVLESGYMQVDESGMPVLDQDHPKGIHKGNQWVYYSPEHKLVCFHYRKGRGKNGPKDMLSGYQGILQSDGWHVYDDYAEVPGISLTGCLAHARRKFHESLQNNKAKSEQALALIQRIYAADRSVKGLEDSERKPYWDEHVRPIFEELRQWVDTELETNKDPKSAYGKALTYATKQWHKLIRIMDYGHVLDNNLIENKIRPLALGRKNYLFAGSHEAAQRIAMMRCPELSRRVQLLWLLQST
ncbi:MAG: IS66 family transposase [Saprospiraceae bacterium]